MGNSPKKATTIWFTTEDEWKNYLEAKKLLKTSKQTVSTWFHSEIRKLLNGRSKGRGAF